MNDRKLLAALKAFAHSRGYILDMQGEITVPYAGGAIETLPVALLDQPNEPAPTE